MREERVTQRSQERLSYAVKAMSRHRIATGAWQIYYKLHLAHDKDITTGEKFVRDLPFMWGENNTPPQVKIFMSYRKNE